MNKTFFETFENRRAAFAERGQVGDAVRAEVVLSSGRIFVVEAIIETTDDWLHFDGHDLADETVLASVIIPYHQVSQVVFTRTRPRTRAAGFTAG